MPREVALRVHTLDRAPMFGTGGETVSIWNADMKSTAAKLTEEAAEAFAEWQRYDGRVQDLSKYRDFVMHEDPETVQGMRGELNKQREALADELSDVIVAAADLAMVCGVDLQAALDRNYERQAQRGRIDG